ncbi:MAG: chloride channel protein [Candidatus Saccharimonadales bacterium]
MKALRLALAIIFVGFGVALTYHLFENAVHGFIDFVWYDTFNTDQNRWIIIPLVITFSFMFFGLQHWLDAKSENAEEHGLGEMPDPTIANFLKVLMIGFFSLVAGATLGPEAILVPSCMILGAYVGKKMFRKQKQIVQLLSAAGIIALFTAFFNSFTVGVLSLFLVLAQTKVKFKPILLVTAVLAAGSASIALNFLDSDAYVQLPSYNWMLNLNTVIFCFVLILAGFLCVQLVCYAHDLTDKVTSKPLKKHTWIMRSIVASVGLIFLYLIGGPLVEFTGNKSIAPMFEQASSLGLVGLVWILIVKIIVIAWSKAIGYRGGMIFPTIFLATVLVAITQLYVNDLNGIYGVIAVIVGAFVANRKTRILV